MVDSNVTDPIAETREDSVEQLVEGLAPQSPLAAPPHVVSQRVQTRRFGLLLPRSINPFRLFSSGKRRQFITFTLIGLVNTALFLVLFNFLRWSGLGPFASNGVAVTVAVTFSFWANTRFTFKVDHGDRRVRRLVEFVAVFGATLAISSAALMVLFRIIDQPTYLQESAVLVVTSGAFSVVRFLILSAWVFNPERAV